MFSLNLLLTVRSEKQKMIVSLSRTLHILDTQSWPTDRHVYVWKECYWSLLSAHTVILDFPFSTPQTLVLFLWEISYDNDKCKWDYVAWKGRREYRPTYNTSNLTIRHTICWEITAKWQLNSPFLLGPVLSVCFWAMDKGQMCTMCDSVITEQSRIPGSEVRKTRPLISVDYCTGSKQGKSTKWWRKTHAERSSKNKGVRSVFHLSTCTEIHGLFTHTFISVEQL